MVGEMADQAHERTGERGTEGRIPGDLREGVDLTKIQGAARERMLAQPLNPFVKLSISLLPRNSIPATQS